MGMGIRDVLGWRARKNDGDPGDFGDAAAVSLLLSVAAWLGACCPSVSWGFEGAAATTAAVARRCVSFRASCGRVDVDSAVDVEETAHVFLPATPLDGPVVVEAPANVADADDDDDDDDERRTADVVEERFKEEPLEAGRRPVC